MTPRIIKPCACGDCTPCGGCDRTVRRRDRTIDDHPGTVEVRRDGLCSRCAYAEKMGYRPSTDVRETIASLAAYLESRRRRGIPAEGLRRAA